MGDHHHHAPVHVPARIVVIASAITLFAGITELIGAHHGHSLFLVADAVHLLAHLGIFFVLLLPAGHGHDRREDIATLCILVIVLAVAGGILYSSGRDLLFRPEEIVHPSALLLSLLGLTANVVTALLFRAPAKGRFSFRAALAHELSDGAMTVVALSGALCVHFFGWYWVDPALSLIVGVWLLLWAGRLLFRRAREGEEAFFTD